MTTLASGELLGEYRLDRRIGSGGMGEVWLATHPRFKTVVLKAAHAHIAEEEKLLEQFFEETRLAKRLDHPNIVKVLDAGKTGKRFFLVMEHVDGLDLRRGMRALGGPLTPGLAATLVADACRGLEYVHRLTDDAGAPLNLVHRDISPDNLMVDTAGVVKLLDFGIARASTTTLTTRAGDRKGKLRYMAPEYALGEDATPATDVYAMGVTLFELVTGKKPFGENDQPGPIALAIMNHGLPSARSVRPEIPEVLSRIVAAAASRERLGRIESADELESLLRRFLESLPPAETPDPGAAVARWMRPRQSAEAPPAPTPRAPVETTQVLPRPVAPRPAPPPAIAVPVAVAPAPSPRPSAPPRKRDNFDDDATQVRSLPLPLIQQLAVAEPDPGSERTRIYPLMAAKPVKPVKPEDLKPAEDLSSTQQMAALEEEQPSPGATQQLEALDDEEPPRSEPLAVPVSVTQDMEAIEESELPPPAAKPKPKPPAK